MNEYDACRQALKEMQRDDLELYAYYMGAALSYVLPEGSQSPPVMLPGPEFSLRLGKLMAVVGARVTVLMEGRR